MEQKEYSVTDFESRIHSLQVVDADGNPIDTSEPVAYKLVAEDGSILKEGMLDGDNIISLDDLDTRKFRVEFETLDVTDTDGFEHIDEDEEQSSEQDEASQEGTGDDEGQSDQAEGGSGSEQSSQESASDDNSGDQTVSDND